MSEVVTLFLAIVSATLAVAAFVFGWKSFRASTELQIRAQDLLSRVEQRVEVIVKHTTRQINQAWDYFTRIDPPTIAGEATDITEREIEFIERTRGEMRAELERLIHEAGLDAAASDELVSGVQAVVEERALDARSQIMRREFMYRLSQIEQDLQSLALLAGEAAGPKATVSDSLRSLERVMARNATREIQRLRELRDSIVHGDAAALISERDLRLAGDLLMYVRRLYEAASRG